MVFVTTCPRLSRFSTLKRCLRSNTIQPIRSTRIIQVYQSPQSCQAGRQVRFQSTTINHGVSPNPVPDTVPLTWNDFLALRKTRRRLNLTMSIICSATTFATGAVVIAQNELENKLSQAIGLDPIITMGLCMMGCGAVGWLIGPFFGTAIFQMRYRTLRALIQAKEKEFFLRIKKHRVDPTRGSYQNPVPDYYGEKIGSVKDYRRWLKDQRAFNLKKEKIL